MVDPTPSATPMPAQQPVTVVTSTEGLRPPLLPLPYVAGPAVTFQVRADLRVTG